MKKLLLAVALSTAAVTVPSLYSQAVSVNGGAIQGTITDAAGAGIGGATVEIRNNGEGTSKTLSTDKSGFYSLGPLTPGAYTVTITAAGFQRMEVTTRILTGTATPGSFKLSIGQSTETVEVTTGDIQVNTDQAGVSDVITREQIASLPVNGRNFLDLAQIEPGVQLQNGNTFDPTKSGYTGISVNGTSGRTTRILLDGQDITDEFVGTTIFNVSQGAINEFQLNRSTQDVAGEVTSQGLVQVSTRSGTNAIHGEAFYIFQDQRSLDANPNASVGHVAPPFQRNQFGGSVGGPILRDKLFYFGNAERIQQKSGSPAGLGSLFINTIGGSVPTVSTPYKQTYSTARLDYAGPFSGHYFARGNYNVDSTLTAGGSSFYSAYANRDNTFGGAFGADFARGRFTHSFRGSYEKFHNFITDASAQGGYNPFTAAVTGSIPVALRYAGQIYFGPNANAPQATYQSDKQLRYDGGYTVGTHNIRFGGAMNRVQSGAYAAFYGIGPRINITAANLLNGIKSATNPLGLGCNGVVGAASCPGDPLNGYNTSSVTTGNGQGYSNNVSNFGLPGGGIASWRFSGYVADGWKVTPNFTLVAGLRYSVDTNRENNGVAMPTCADTSATVRYACGSSAGSTSLLTLWNPTWTDTHINQPYNNLGPNFGINYSPGDHKTVFRAGFGLYYESIVFNNGANAEGNIQKVAPSYTSKNPCVNSSVTFPDGTIYTSLDPANPNNAARPFSSDCLNTTVKNSAAAFANFEQRYQASSKANQLLTNGAYLGNTLNASGLYGTKYEQPVSEQWNFGTQRELVKGGILSVDYIHNMTWRIGQTIDLNHTGAARTYNATYGLAAVNRVAASVTRNGGCAAATTVAAGPATVNCILANGIGASGTTPTISTFASAGLDGAAYTSSSNYKYAGKTTPAAFPGLNSDLGSGSFIRPTGRSGYDALQVVYRQSTSRPVPGIEHGNFQVSYNLSRVVSNLSSGTSGDQFFTSAAYDNDNPGSYIGRNGLDRKHELSFGGALNLKYGPEVGIIGHFFSAQPSNLALDASLATGNIFQSDITGDGTTGDIAPGTLPGDYMHRIKSDTLGNYITAYNGTYAGKATPAGQAVLSSGLFTLAQLTTLKGVIQPIAQLPQARASNNPDFRSLDVNFSYPIRLSRFREGMSLQPRIAFYNVGNFSNFSATTSTLFNTTTAGGPVNTSTGSQLTGVDNFGVQASRRTYRGVGTFSQGAPRQTEYQLTLKF